VKKFHGGLLPGTLPGTLVDATIGLYMVSRTTQGTQAPLHVRFDTTSGHEVIRCEDNGCEEAYAAAKRAKHAAFRCKHVSAAALVTTPVSSSLDAPHEDTLQRLVETKILKESSAKGLAAEATNATEEGTPLVVAWAPSPETSSHMFFSVHHGRVTDCAKQCRVIVTLNKSTMHLSCPCSAYKSAKRGLHGLRCLHTKVCL
jgi:hypothetical protein